jgi:hypothetical protein
LSVDGDKLPLIVVSHGRVAHFVSHHDTLETLAAAGFVVAAINHAGDTYFDMSRSGDLSAWVVDRKAGVSKENSEWVGNDGGFDPWVVCERLDGKLPSADLLAPRGADDRWQNSVAPAQSLPIQPGPV